MIETTNQVQENINKNKPTRQQYKYELVGRIIDKRRRKTSPQKQIEGKKYDEYFYQLNVVIENKERVNKIFCFKSSLETEKV
jgi:hypothetical protein